MSSIPIFDGHNDVLLRLWLKKTGDPVADFIAGDGKGHLDLPRMAAGGFAGGMFAVFVPNSDEDHADDDDLNPPLAGEVKCTDALSKALSMAALLFRIEREAAGRLRICRSAADISQAMAARTIAAVLHIEGAEAIDSGLRNLDVLYASGLRSLGPVWSRPNAFGHGVPFRFPSSPDTGPGLTEAGKALIRRCNELRIAIDLSHLNERGFRDVAKISKAPLIASHSNVHGICPSSRNLSDRQIQAIGASGGMIGLNFANGFLRPDGQWRGDTGLDVMLRHLDRMLDLAGPDHVGLGSDFEGARIPAAIGDVTGLPVLLQAMREHGYDEAMMRKLCFENWLAVLERTWGG
ncbi:MAG: dipeptidase [Hyphomicrobiales bacterium]